MGFNRRNRWELGRWLVIDEESGVTRYNDEVRQDVYGRLVTREYADDEHPQDFIKPAKDPEAVPYGNPPNTSLEVCNVEQLFIGETNVPRPKSPFSHVYRPTGIGNMEIGCSFVVS